MTTKTKPRQYSDLSKAAQKEKALCLAEVFNAYNDRHPTIPIKRQLLRKSIRQHLKQYGRLDMAIMASPQAAVTGAEEREALLRLQALTDDVNRHVPARLYIIADDTPEHIAAAQAQVRRQSVVILSGDSLAPVASDIVDMVGELRRSPSAKAAWKRLRCEAKRGAAETGGGDDSAREKAYSAAAIEGCVRERALHTAAAAHISGCFLLTAMPLEKGNVVIKMRPGSKYAPLPWCRM